MPTLNWIGKDAVVNHHLEVPFRLLKDMPELSCGECLIGRERLQSERIVVRQTTHESKRNVERFPDDFAFQAYAFGVIRFEITICDLKISTH